MIAEARRRLDGLDALVVNVGIGLGSGLANTSPQDWERVSRSTWMLPFRPPSTACPNSPTAVRSS